MSSARHPSVTATPFDRLSDRARRAWGKHDRKTEDWLPLWRHMADSAAVAGRLWDEWVPQNVKDLVAEPLPDGAADARRLAVFLAAVHDIGKATPAFSCQVDGLAQRMRDAGLDMPYQKQFGTDRRMAPHGLAGQLLLQEWLSERFGWTERASGQFAVVAGGHHGTPPEHQQIHDLRLNPRLLRTSGDSEDNWRVVQRELMDACASVAGVEGRLADWASVRLPQTVQIVLTAVVILSDWIASSSELFPYDPVSWAPSEGSVGVGGSGEVRRLEAAWRGLDLPGPWSAAEPQGTAAELFAERFELPEGAEIRPVQEAAVRLAQQMPAAGLLIIEAPMGEGKTEAAFAATEILAARSGAGGCLVALPTRATGDAMFPRLLDWLDRLPSDGPRSVVLAHAKAALNDRWSGLLETGNRTIAAVETDGSERVAGAADERRTSPAGLHAHQWLRGRKKALLASFAVGTIDQVLFAGLKSRHLALRHLAVAGKVVVIDEVHAYDAYMNAYLERVLEWLAAYRVPVVLLSATLPAGRRRALAAAYAGWSIEDAYGEFEKAVEVGAPAVDDSGGGDGGAPAADDGSRGGGGARAASIPTGDAYPLLTAVAPEAPVRFSRPAAASGRRTEIALESLDDDLTELVRRVDAELADGGCALVVRNTVDRVLDAAEALRAHFGADAVTVAHSRFLAADRARKDTELRTRFGRDGDRPAGPHIVVASQVVEQSLDIDFDLLVTDLAPVDLMLQRMGRLHRHPRTRPARLTRARCLVTGAQWRADPPEPVRGSISVYQGPHTLLRTLAVLRPHLDGEPLVLPDHISPLVQTAYGNAPIGPAHWADAMDESRRAYEKKLTSKRDHAETFRLGPVRRAGRAVVGWLEANAGDVDDSRAGRAQVRDSEESLEVLVVQRQPDGRLTTVEWLDGGRGGLYLPEHCPPTRRAAEAVAASALTLPWQFSRTRATQRTIAELERFLVPGWQVKECPWLAGELLLVLDGDCQTRLAGFELRYSYADGLRVTAVDAPGTTSTTSTSNTTDTTQGHRPTDTRDTSDAREAAGAAGTNGTADMTAAASTHSMGAALPKGPVAPARASFDLVARPWLPVQRDDGTTVELSLREVFAQAHGLRRLVGDLPTQEFALLRLLLAILYDALEGPAEREDWEELWEDPESFAAVADYLDRHRDRFDLLHPEHPFFQVAGLHTAKEEVASLNRIVADVPNGEPFFAMRRPGVERLSLAEAARWLVHAHAFDPSGIKSGMVGDDRVKGGKVYPQGTGWAGGLGGVHAEGHNLRETLLLNLIPTDEGILTTDGKRDLPVWRRPATGPGVVEEAESDRRPSGPCDLYTWQSRRMLLHSEGDTATGVVLGYGDPLTPYDRWKSEPMTAWRRSPAQEKKQGRGLVYLPRQHDASRAAWRGMASLLPARRAAGEDSGRGEAPSLLPSGVVRWLTMLPWEGPLQDRKLIRTRLVGAVYGTQQSVVDEVVEDSVTLPVVLLDEERPLYAAAAVNAVADAEAAVTALGQLAGNLARAAGSDPASGTSAARDLGFGALDGPYRQWLVGLGEYDDPEAARAEWQTTVSRIVRRLGERLLDTAGPSAWEGRITEIPGVGTRWIDDSRADLWFRTRLNKILPGADRRNGRGDEAEGADASDGDDGGGGDGNRNGDGNRDVSGDSSGTSPGFSPARPGVPTDRADFPGPTDPTDIHGSPRSHDSHDSPHSAGSPHSPDSPDSPDDDTTEPSA